MMTCNIKQTCTPWNGCRFEFSKPVKLVKPQCPCIEKIKNVQSDVDEIKGDVARNTQKIQSNFDQLTEQIGDLAEQHHNDYEYTINYINEKDAENDYLLELEKLRALQAESDLDDKITAEKNRAKQAEEVLDVKLNQEIADRIADVNEEESRATAAEDGLETSIAREIANRIADVDEELERATDAENTLNDKLDAEIHRATNAENGIDNKIDNEIIRATASEGALQDSIDALEAQHAADVNTLNNTIDNRIDLLINGAPAALDTLGEIADQLRDDEDAVTALVATIAHETSDRLNADSDLLTRLQAEITRSAGKDGEHDTSISQLATSVSGLQSDKADKVNMSAGTYTKVTVNGQGIVTAGLNPTTLAGYGITDANISNGKITLGNSSITPLISHQDISGKADKSNTAAGTYNKVTVNAQGIVTNGENPNTLAGHGITDAYKKSEVDALILQLSNRIAALESDVAVLKTYWEPKTIAGENLLTTGYTINTLGYR